MESEEYPDGPTSSSTVVTFPGTLREGGLRTLRDVSCSVIDLAGYKTRKDNYRMQYWPLGWPLMLLCEPWSMNPLFWWLMMCSPREENDGDDSSSVR